MTIRKAVEFVLTWLCLSLCALGSWVNDKHPITALLVVLAALLGLVFVGVMACLRVEPEPEGEVTSRGRR